MSEESNKKSPEFLKMKKVKVDILKRCKEVEDKYGIEKASSFLMHQTKSVMKNIAFWKIPTRGVITSDDVRLAIYQLEKAGLIELVDHQHLCLTTQGRKIADEIRSLPFEEIADTLIGIKPPNQTSTQFILRCHDCGREIEPDSVYCRYCGTKVVIETEFCTYCGAAIQHGSYICPVCGKKV
ncbi:MAG: zinc-ribbon domain-containing protein [Candidatus Helarchaeota archaeon]